MPARQARSVRRGRPPCGLGDGIRRMRIKELRRGDGSQCRFRLFEAEEMGMTALVPGDDQLVGIGNGAAIRRGVAAECCEA
jgi:hypothetical protein